MSTESRIALPEVPAELAGSPVAAWREPITIDTYAPAAPSIYPEYLETRVFQGSSGSVYPLPFFERIEHTKAPQQWDAVHLENEYLRLMILPELGGRIHIGQDKTNGYDFFYRNNVIKPALVGLTGPWISGGMEFNWPQHHRPGTFLPTECVIEREPSGAVTVWCADLDPFARMKGMHGVRLMPGSALIELRVRVFNRTEDTQTFLWWSNVAARVNDDYQSFFPTDVTCVADHAKRATTTFPRVSGRYYGVDYPARVDAEHPDADRIDWYRNIPVPTSYMCMETRDDFFGGYDHGARAGFVYWADHRIAPGKKQWTWGNAPFGWAWDRQLTDSDGPYVELMAGAYTDNQPDFTFIAPGETKTFSQYWYPIRQIGPAHQASRAAAVSLEVNEPDPGRLRLGVAASAPHPGARIRLTVAGRVLFDERVNLAPDAPYVTTRPLDPGARPEQVSVAVLDGADILVSWRPRPAAARSAAPAPVTAIPAPDQIATNEELYLSALHLEQYRHATRSPEPYLLEALRRDPTDARCNTLYGARLYRQGRYGEAARLLRTAVDRLTMRNPNPYDGEPHYRLGLALRRLGRREDAYDALAKATWARAWRPAAQFELARMDFAAGDAAGARRRVGDLLSMEGENLRAIALAVICERALGESAAAQDRLRTALELDPLDWWLRDLAGLPTDADATIHLDVALEYRALGLADRELAALDRAIATERDHPVPGLPSVTALAHYYRAEALAATGRTEQADEALRAAQSCALPNAVLARLDDADLISARVAADPSDATAHALLGNWLYAQRRYTDAVAEWQAAVELDAADAVSWRGLAVAAFNVLRDPQRSDRCYERAIAARPGDPKLRYERDQLAIRRRVAPARRLDALAGTWATIEQRDDLLVVAAEALTMTGEASRAIALLAGHEFGPWEGGEGQALGAWDHAHLTEALAALRRGDAAASGRLIEAALDPPPSLGEGRHLLANCSDLWLALGDALAAQGDEAAREWWQRAAAFEGDFQSMACVPYSELTAYSVLALRRLGDDEGAARLTKGLAGYADDLAVTPQAIDYFATSLPTMLLFHDDLDARRDVLVALMRAQVADLRGDASAAESLLAEVLAADPNLMRARLWQMQRAGE